MTATDFNERPLADEICPGAMRASPNWLLETPMLFEEGRNVKQVAEWLGHADPAFTPRTYVRLLDDGVRDADFFDSATVGLKETGMDQ